MLLYSLLAEVSPSPAPEDMVDPNLVTPGPLGFAVIALLVVLLALLIWDMQRRVRRTRYRNEIRAELDAEEAQEAQERASVAEPFSDEPKNLKS